MYIKRLISVAVAVSLLAAVAVIPASALNAEDITAPAAVLMEAGSRKILFEKNPHEQRACASITKVMTLLLVMEAIESGKINYDDTVTASAHAASMGGSDIWLEEGETMTVHEMIKATVVASANDAAVALAELVSGSEDDFVSAMNNRAGELNMKDTVFKNCNGLDEEGHITSAYDVAIMSSELMKHEKIFEYTGIWLDYLRDGKTQIVNTNKLLKTYDGITGLKTGTTSQAGSCISATATRGGMSLIAVVLGAESGTDRFKNAAALLDFGFANYEVVTFDAKAHELETIPVKNGMKGDVKISCNGISALVVQKGTKDKVKESVTLADDVEAPVEKGTKVGTITYSLNDENISSFDIVTDDSVEKMTFSAIFAELFDALIRM